MQFPLRISRHSEPRAVSTRLVEAVARGETGSCIAYGRGTDPILHKIDTIVRAELPAVNVAHARFPRGERLWVWSLGEPEGVAYFPKQEPQIDVALSAREEQG